MDRMLRRPSYEELLQNNVELLQRLEESDQTLQAIRRGEVDALVIEGANGPQIYSISGAEHVYRVVIETMNEAALTVAPDGTTLFCNRQFADLVKTPMDEVIGRRLPTFFDLAQADEMSAFLRSRRSARRPASASSCAPPTGTRFQPSSPALGS